MSMTPWFTSGCYPAGVAVDWDEVLKRQIEYFSSDELLRDRAAVYRDMTPEECWVETRELCGMLDWFLDRMDPEVRARAMEPEPLSDELIAILEAMQRQQ
jgi:hypothetical protein